MSVLYTWKFTMRVDLMLSDLLQKEKTKYKMRGTQEETLEVMSRFIVLIMMMVLWVYTYLQIHQVVHRKYFCFHVSPTSEAVKKKRKREFNHSTYSLDQSLWIWCIWEICQLAWKPFLWNPEQ